MNPITCTFAPMIYTEWGYNNLINWINSGFSNYNFTLDGYLIYIIWLLFASGLIFQLPIIAIRPDVQEFTDIAYLTL